MRLTGMQMDRISQRGAPRNLRIPPCITWFRRLSLTRPVFQYPQNIKPKFVLLFSADVSSHQLIMEKYSQETESSMKDQLRGGDCKETSAAKETCRISDILLPHILKLYASRAEPQDFEIYAPEATFEDPLMLGRGVKEIKSAFYSLGKVFSESRIVEYTVQEHETSPGKTEILIDNKQYYKFLGKDVDVISLIKIYTENGKIVRHEDLWDKKALRNKETIKSPLFGSLMEATKRASMFATHALMRFGKDPPL